MSHCELLLVFLLAWLLSASSTPPPPQTPAPSPIPVQPPRSPSHFFLAVTWPPTFCLAQSFKSGSVSINKFTLHGLWPQDSKGPIIKCDPTNHYPFDKQALQPIITELHTYWPSLTKADDVLWKDQWRKHGTCTIPMFNERTYLDQGLKLMKSLDILPILAKAKIVPGGSQTFSMAQVQAAFNGLPNIAPPYLTCERGRKDNKLYLVELNFCLSPDASKFLDCGKFYQTGGSCGENFGF